MSNPENLYYSPQHVWVKKSDDGSFLAGITDHAQEALGDIVFVELPAIGQNLQTNQSCGLLESVKTGSDLYAPLNGTVIAINEALSATPELINDAPYKNWIFQFKATNPEDLTLLLSAKAYSEQIG
jgi:glycine cleavage system H protein